MMFVVETLKFELICFVCNILFFKQNYSVYILNIMLLFL